VNSLSAANGVVDLAHLLHPLGVFDEVLLRSDMNPLAAYSFASFR